MDPVTIAAAATAASAGFNAIAQGKMNKKTRQWNEKMYEKQKADNLALWKMQNEYNSPLQQMQRLQEGGLNPNLVYGNGTVANNANTPDAGSVPSWSPKAPDIDVGPTISTFFDVRQRSAQTRILEEQAKQAAIKTQYDQDTLTPRTTSVYTALDRAVTENLISTRKAEIIGRTMESTISNAQKQLDYLDVQIGRGGAETDRIKTDTVRLKLENDLRKNGINPNDPIWMRIIGRIINEAIPGVSVFQKGKETYGR